MAGRTTSRGARSGPTTVDVVVEVGAKRIFASALDWPGWVRSAKASQGDDAALVALADYTLRYAPVAGRAELAVEFAAAGATASGGHRLRVVDRLRGDATTDFGAPSQASEVEQEAVDATAAQRLVALLDACWSTLDHVAAEAPDELRKGPRGGGRDRDAVVAHVVNAEVAYARRLGLRQVSAPDLGDRAAVDDLRARVRATLADALPGGAAGAGSWSPRYAVRRMAWHVLDHAREIEDRAQP